MHHAPKTKAFSTAKGKRCSIGKLGSASNMFRIFQIRTSKYGQYTHIRKYLF